jgi:hypothetical protein
VKRIIALSGYSRLPLRYMQAGNEYMMKSGIIISICIFLALVTLAHTAEQNEYPSPNGKYRAYVTALSTARQGSGESKVTIKTGNGQIICTKSYGSKDGQHGSVVVKAAWTPDSNFFVYSMSSSGGHQPWHFPIDFISVVDSGVRNLDAYVGSVTDSCFELRVPDTIKAVATKRGIDEEAFFEVRLSELVARERKK